MELSKAISGFLLFKEGEGLSPNTIKTYQIHLRYFSEFLEGADLEDITPADVLRFLQYMRRDHKPKRWSGSTKPLSSQTIRNIWVALRSFYTWAGQVLQAPDVMQHVPAPKATNAEREPFTAKEVKRLLDVVKPRRAKKPRSGYRYVQMLRDQAIILVLLDTGLRASELCRLTIGDLHLSSGRISVTGKGSKHRYVRLATVCRRAVWQYLAEREDGNDPDRPLFVTNNNRRLKRHWLRKRLANIGEEAGVEDVYPHRFRYTFAIQYLRNGGDIFTLQMLLGHSSLKMVRYYAKLADVDSDKMHAIASPVDGWLKR